MSQKQQTPAPVSSQGSAVFQHESRKDVASTGNIAPSRDSRKAVEFLKSYRPAGPWVLVAIVPDGKIRTNTFTDPELMFDWIDAVNGSENLYFHVNSTGSARLMKKASKEDIVAAEWLHVDVDPVGKDLDAERDDILSRLQSYEPAPSVIIDSGGGYQAFWRLAEPVELADETALDEVEAANRALEIALGGDHCHNVDRIMRLPGTMNVPNKKKREKGREPRLATLVIGNFDRTYTFTDFPKAELLSEDGSPRTSLPVVSLDELPMSVRCRMLIVTGSDPDEPDRYSSRSEALWAALCEMARRKIAPAQMAAVVLDRQNAISGHLYDQSDPQAAAERQIARAVDKVATDFTRTEKGEIVRTYRNTCLAILKLGVTTEHDTFANRLNLGGHELQQWVGEVSDHACAVLRNMILGQYGFDPGKQHVFDAVEALCVENPCDPVVDALQALRWDGKSRLDDWLVRLMGADDTPYVRAVGRLLLRGMVERARDPGCKFDYIVVLEGKQGTGKSSALRILCGDAEWFSDERLLAQSDKARGELLQGVWLFELSELGGLRKADVDDLKAFASRAVDRYRPAYGRNVITRPRRTVLVGTTNEDSYMRDSTGERRFLPVLTGAIDLAGIRAERDQLMAEAWAADDPLVLPESLWAVAAAEQAERRQRHPWEDTLGAMSPEERWGGYERCSSLWLLGTILGIEPGKQTRPDALNLAAAMRALGWEGPKTIKVRQSEGAVKGYIRQSDKPDLLPDPPF